MRLKLLLLAGLMALSTPVFAKTIYTGDKVDGTAVIDKLDVADLPAAAVTKLWFRVADNSVGQGWYVPVVVIKGAKPGPKFLLTAGIHGDELNGIAVIQRLVSETDPKTLSGTLVAVPGLNAAGLEHSTRAFSGYHSGSGGNLNRLMPNDTAEHGHEGDAATRYAGRLWSNIFMGNADFAIDLHTQSRGGTYPAYVFAQTAPARHIADMLRPDVINMDPGIDGAVENMLNAVSVPAVTYELGGAEVFDSTLITRGLRGVRNVMIDRGMIAGTPDLSDPEPYIGNEVTNVESPRGGWSHVKVKLNQSVKKGDVLATVTDPFGQIIATLTAPFDAHILGMGTDPRTQPGDMVVRLITWSDKGVCARTSCPEAAPMVKSK